MRTLRLSLAGAVIVMLLAGPTGAVPAVAADPAGVTPSVSGWVVVRQQPSSTGYTPAPGDQGNSAGGTNTVTRPAKGSYTVHLPGLDRADGNPQVTAMNSEPRWCLAGDWGLVGHDVDVDVFCYDRAGALANSRFVLTYTVGSGSEDASAGQLAYFWDGDGTTSLTPDPTRQYTSAGTTSTVERTGVGRYTATIPGLGLVGGDAQVSSYSAASTCRVIDWQPAGVDLVVHVACQTPLGVDMDAGFQLLFLDRLGPEGYGGGPSAYLWANRPTVTSYHPAKAYRYDSAGGAMTVMRGLKGVYTVVLGGMPVGGAAIVTAYGAGQTHCQLSSIGTSGPSAKVLVRCFAPSGSLEDSRFTLAYTK